VRVGELILVCCRLRWSAVLAIAVSGLFFACNGRIGTSTIEPNPACVGQQVYITYHAEEGDPYLISEDDLGIDLAIPPSSPSFGVKTFEARSDATITFRAQGIESSEERSISLTVRDPSQPIELRIPGECGPSWAANLPATEWPEAGRVVRVENSSDTLLNVTHADETHPIPSPNVLQRGWYGGVCTLKRPLFYYSYTKI
jgi:hypothetical protein